MTTTRRPAANTVVPGSRFPVFDVNVPVPSVPVFNAGRDNSGAFATGAFSTATATNTATIAPDPNVNIAATLAALRDVLAAVPGIERKAVTRIEEAHEEAAKPAPKREEVKGLVEQSLKYAKDAAGFAEAAGKVAPLVAKAAAWIGTTAGSLGI